MDVVNVVLLLTPKRTEVIFLQKMLKSAISSSVSKNGKKNSIFGILTVRSFPRLLQEHVQKVSKKLTGQILR
jgi:hypothetical protein